MIEDLGYTDDTFLWTREQHSWLYMQPSDVRSDDAYLSSEISRFIVTIQSKDYDPEKYRSFSEVTT